jgi:hypothetical protein
MNDGKPELSRQQAHASRKAKSAEAQAAIALSVLLPSLLSMLPTIPHALSLSLSLTHTHTHTQLGVCDTNTWLRL